MNNKDLETLRHAQGWLGSQIQSMLDDSLLESDSPGGPKQKEAERQLAQHVMNMWILVDRGVDRLARENNALSLKIAAMRIALDS